MPLSTWKSGLACFMQMFYFIENQHCQTGRYKIKVHISGKQGLPIVQLNHSLIFSFFQVCWEHSSQASYFRNNKPIKGKPTTSLLSASCLLTFSDNSEACFFCTTQLLKVNFSFRSFLSSISPYGAHHSLKP